MPCSTFPGRAAYGALKAADLSRRRRGLGATINRSAFALSLMLFHAMVLLTAEPRDNTTLDEERAESVNQHERLFNDRDLMSQFGT
jgi:hypothetical protein